MRDLNIDDKNFTPIERYMSVISKSKPKIDSPIQVIQVIPKPTRALNTNIQINDGENDAAKPNTNVNAVQRNKHTRLRYLSDILPQIELLSNIPQKTIFKLFFFIIFNFIIIYHCY